MKKPAKTSKQNKTAKASVKKVASGRVVKTSGAKKAVKAVAKPVKKQDKPVAKKTTKAALSTPISKNKKEVKLILKNKQGNKKIKPVKEKVNEKKTSVAVKINAPKPVKSISLKKEIISSNKKNKKGGEKEDKNISLSDTKDLDIEILKELRSSTKSNKKKSATKKSPIVKEEEEEIRPTFSAKSLTQALVGPPSTPRKTEIITKTKSKYQRFELEFLVHSSIKLLFEFISTPSGLSEWFSDDVNFRNDIYTFYWDKAEQKAKLIQIKENKSVRFQWLEENKDIYFDFRIEVDELTGDVALIITDFAEDDESREAATLLWNSQVESLLKAIGSY